MSGELAATLGTLVTAGKAAALERAAVRARLPWVEIDAAAPMTLNLDGEPLEARRFRIECVAARIRARLAGRLPAAVARRGACGLSATARGRGDGVK